MAKAGCADTAVPSIYQGQGLRRRPHPVPSLRYGLRLAGGPLTNRCPRCAPSLTDMATTRRRGVHALQESRAMIASNYRKHPEALALQLPLPFSRALV